MTTISDRLKRWRGKHDVSLRALADRTGVSAAQLSNIESGRARLTLNVAAKLDPVLRVSLKTLCAEEARHAK